MNLPNARWPLLLAGAALFTSAAHAQSNWRRNSSWTRHFRAGIQLGVNIDANFSTSGDFGISGSQPGATGVPDAEHFYDDGYVRVDATGNAEGYTSYWGYKNRGQQYNEAAQTLTFHSARAFSVSSENRSTDDPPYVGFDMAYGGDLRRWGRARVGWELGLGLLPISIEDNRNLAGTFVRTVHQFATGGITIPGENPNDGYNADRDTIGSAIFSTANAQPDEFVQGTIMGSRSLDVTLYNLRLGPTLSWPLHPRWTVSASAGGAIGLVSGNYKFNEFTAFANGGTSRNTGKFGQTEVVYGAYVSALVLFHVEEHADIFVGAQFMPLSDAKFSEGGRQAKLNLGSGLYFTTGINWPF